MVGRQAEKLCKEKTDAKAKVEAFISKISSLEEEMTKRAHEEGEKRLKEEEKLRLEEIHREETKLRENERRVAEEEARKKAAEQRETEIGRNSQRGNQTEGE